MKPPMKPPERGDILPELLERRDALILEAAAVSATARQLGREIQALDERIREAKKERP